MPVGLPISAGLSAPRTANSVGLPISAGLSAPRTVHSAARHRVTQIRDACMCLQNGASFLGNISSILQQQEQAIAHALASEPRGGPARGLLQVLTLLTVHS